MCLPDFPMPSCYAGKSEQQIPRRYASRDDTVWGNSDKGQGQAGQQFPRRYTPSLALLRDKRDDTVWVGCAKETEADGCLAYDKPEACRYLY